MLNNNWVQPRLLGNIDIQSNNFSTRHLGHGQP